MFTRLRQKWQVGGFKLLLIICTFALGGSLCGLAARKLLNWFAIEKGVGWILVYIVTAALLWPCCVLLVSIPLGQFVFFKNYLLKIKLRMTEKSPRPVRLAIFASGAGSNAKKIIEHAAGFAGIENPPFTVSLVVSNKPGAGVLQIAADNQIDTLIIEKERFFRGDGYLPELAGHGIGFIVLAGFLWKVPSTLVAAYPGKIVNIHPALLPAYGGKGMYGDRVHEAVIAAGEQESGITIHYVDEIYDHGNIIFQAKCTVDENETPASLAQKIHALEHLHYSTVVEKLVKTPK